MVLERFAKKIRSLRERSGMTQESFANEINMDRTYYAAVENGKHNISLKNIEKIANGFGITLEELFKDV